MTEKTNPYYSVDDNCYVLDRSNKIKFCEITKVITEDKDYNVVYQLRDLIDYRYFIAKHEDCCDTEAEAKKLKSSRSGKQKMTDKIKRKSRKTKKR